MILTGGKTISVDTRWDSPPTGGGPPQGGVDLLPLCILGSESRPWRPRRGLSLEDGRPG